MPEHLWAPWRLKYIEADKASEPAPECVFCALPKHGNDRESLILARGETMYVVMNRYPYTNGHLMVIPYAHAADLEAMSDASLLEANVWLRAAMSWLREAYGPQGYNIGMNVGSAAGAGIPCHLHWHILPRWAGDTNFMTTVGEVRVHPTSLEDTYDRLFAICSRP